MDLFMAKKVDELMYKYDLGTLMESDTWLIEGEIDTWVIEQRDYQE